MSGEWRKTCILETEDKASTYTLVTCLERQSTRD